jgi:PhnB protein
MERPDGKLGHAEFQIGETILFLSDEWAEMNVRGPKSLGASAVSFVVDVPDVDAAFARAVEAGAKVERPVSNEGFGRIGWLHDPWGHRWAIMTGAKPE